MKNIFKKIVIAGVFMASAAALFAEPASTGVTDSDVKNWAKNIIPIMSELNELGVWTGDTISATAKQKSSVESILHKNGISGSNCVEKFIMITNCAVVVFAEADMDPQTLALIQSLGMDPLADIKKNTNSKDYAVVAANSKAVADAYDRIQEYNANSDSSGAADDSSYSDEELAELYGRLGSAFAQYGGSSNDDSDPEQAEIIKKLYEQISKAKGDSGYIYKTKKSASKYKKTNYKKGTVLTKEDGYGSDELNWSFDLDKKKATLDFKWNKNTKTINYTITSVEYYYTKVDSDMGGESMEYVVSTKEGPVFHFFKDWDFTGNQFDCKIGIKGVDFESISKVNWEYNNWSDHN